MPPEIIDCIQGTPEWFTARAGIPTASEFAKVMREKGKGEGGTSKQRTDYIYKIAGEIIGGEPSPEGYTNAFMERGKLLEDEARKLYAFTRGVDPEIVGFVRNGRRGCSPDSLLDADGVLEIKTAIPGVMVERILRNEFPIEHKPQCQGALWVCEREWCDLVVYCPKFPLFVKRAYRDAAYIQKLADAVDAFNVEVDEVVARVRSYNGLVADDLRADLKSALEGSLV